MKPFTHERPQTPTEAAAAAVRTPDAKFIAGGTNLLDLMKLEIETPRHLIDVNALGLDKIEPCLLFHRGEIPPEVHQTVSATKECGEISRVQQARYLQSAAYLAASRASS